MWKAVLCAVALLLSSVSRAGQWDTGVIPITYGWVDSPFVNAAGDRIYFMHTPYSILDWATDPTSRDHVYPVGKYLAGSQAKNSIYPKFTDLFYTQWSGTSWSTPTSVGNINKDSSGECCIWLSDDELTVVFHRDGLDGKSNILATRADRDSTAWTEVLAFEPGLWPSNSQTDFRADINFGSVTGDAYMGNHRSSGVSSFIGRIVTATDTASALHYVTIASANFVTQDATDGDAVTWAGATSGAGNIRSINSTTVAQVAMTSGSIPTAGGTFNCATCSTPLAGAAVTSTSDGFNGVYAIAGLDSDTVDETQPYPARNELTLLFNRRGAGGATTLWRSTRATITSAWGTPVQVSTTGFADSIGGSLWGEISMSSSETFAVAVLFDTSIPGWSSKLIYSVGTPTTSFSTPVSLSLPIVPVDTPVPVRPLPQRGARRWPF